MFQAATKMAPTFDPAWAGYTAMLFTNNQPAKAVALAQQYANANPKRVQAMFIYASALATTRKFDLALSEYQKVLAVDPKNAAALPAYGTDLR